MISSFINAGPDAAQRAALRGASRVQPRAMAATPARRIAARALHHWASALDPAAGAHAATRTPASAATLYRRAA
jgi:hypothetical protein